MENLSLFHIEQDLAELMAAREDALANGFQSPEDQSTTVAAIDEAIQQYATREVAKVDGIRGYLRWTKAQIAEARAEADRQTARANQLEAGADRLKQFVVDVMQSAGKKRLDGKTGALMVKGNGGVEPLVIDDESLVPDELCWMEGKIRADVWAEIINVVQATGSEGLKYLYRTAVFKRVASPSLVREALAKNCTACCGRPLEFDGMEAASMTCMACGGSGRAGIPGVRLAHRGVHLELR